MIRKFNYIVSQKQDGMTIEAFLKQQGYSHGCIVHLKKTAEGIKKNGVWAYVKERLKAGDTLETVFIEETASEKIAASELPLDILYEDEDILVVNKPADMPIHPSLGNYDNSLANAVAAYYEKQGIPFVFRCVNRLDRDTTGLVVIAKNMLSGAILGKAMLERKIHRTYLAVVEGKLAESGSIDLPITRKEGSAIERCVDQERGERAVTHYKCLQRGEKYSLAKVWLETGRTHQIRVHMNAIGHPLPGDFLYHPDFSKIQRQALHSWRLEFFHPITGKPMKFEQEMPEDMKKLLTTEKGKDKDMATLKQGETKLQITIPERKGYTTTYCGTDYEQVVDDERNIYQPLVDTEVKVSFKMVKDSDPSDYSFEEIAVTIPGIYTKEHGDNEAPRILPELREWKGYTGSFTAADSARIVIQSEKLRAVAATFAADYKALTGKEIEISIEEAAEGDFCFALTGDKTKGLKEEGYLMEIKEKVLVEAETTTGAYWATRTILQALKSGNGSIPKGMTRDYPLYKIRGFILDVGRKAFTLAQLEQIVKQMSWYKMNDFQVHLNDNLIELENVEEPMKAYSGFRLESDIKKGGNHGLNQADLTSMDMFYTKDEFRRFIKESRVRGVNIVPEIDVPAHSLALTKVRPDLRHGTAGRDNDHLNLTDKYDESLEFVQSIFDEYMGAELKDPVFDKQTTVHVGADEYTADGNAYRRFAKDMLSYVKDSGRMSRIWGSLTRITGNVEVPGENVQMNLWNSGWADMKQMYEEGFGLINCNDENYYIVPYAGYYHDYLDAETMYDQEINTIGNVTIPAGDKQMLGGAFALWNDMIDYHDTGISAYDIYKRFNESLGLFAAKLWGKSSSAMSLDAAKAVCKIMGDAPNSNVNSEKA